jgi:hypothetical protein
MNKERLQQMVTMLRGLPEENQFNLEIWSCGTSACAVGWACVNPVFIEQGLKRRHTGAPEFKGLTSWDAVEAFFEINLDESEHLFDYGTYPKFCGTGPGEVADRIEAFIAE